DVRYSNRHEWVKVERNICTVGLSEYASKQLGDVVYIELPQIDAKLHKDDEVGVVESVKAATELYSPVGGTVKHINTKVVDKPSLLNKSPQDDGMLF
uniref:Glycine cleavage system H protein n=1 Tax=Mesocestoides corti TaxID=53468 RepID=A0A5K3FWF2_MESCO